MGDKKSRANTMSYKASKCKPLPSQLAVESKGGEQHDDVPVYPDTVDTQGAEYLASTSMGQSVEQDTISEHVEGIATTENNGRIDIDLSSTLVRRLSHLYSAPSQTSPESPPSYTPTPPSPHVPFPLKLNIVIQVVGSRGDIQPFIALGASLQRHHGHRVRIATHPIFSSFVRSSGLEFHSIGGDPTELMAYMVKNPGLLPSMSSLRAGEISKKRAMIKEMLQGCWESCIERDEHTGDPFTADAIIANPPSFAHVHCAQRLGVPVHLMFTMPWSATRAFAHPLVNLRNGEKREKGWGNYVSYGVVEWLTWQGLSDVINDWRETLDLEPVAVFDGPNLAATLKVPFTYCWSPALVPKPLDWPEHIDVCGFFFRDAPHYEPPPDLLEFIEAGEPPVYIGFGSIVLADPERMTAAIIGAVEALGIRAIVSKGWSNLGSSSEHHGKIMFIGDCPHEWLFQKVAAVVHHGGAGTTACGLKNGRPTTVVPFFGDQIFWGQMIASAGAGPDPIPQKEFTVASLTDALRYCLSPKAVEAAAEISRKMDSEAGVETAVASFHRHLPVEKMVCDIYPHLPASWQHSSLKNVKLSSLAVEALLSSKVIEKKRLSLYESKSVHIEPTRWDPITGGASAVLSTTAELTGSLTGIVTRPISEYRSGRERRERTAARSKASEANLTLEAPQTSDTTSIASSSTQRKGASAGDLAAASALSVASFAPRAVKGMMVDIPLALTEGLRGVPGLYGEKVRDNGAVTNWKSGATVAGKTFAFGFMDGMSDVVMKPYQGAKKEGVLGFTKGVGKGSVSLVANSGAAMFGLLAYTGAGIAKSVRSATHTKTKKSIEDARRAEGSWLMGKSQFGREVEDSIMSRFHTLKKGKGSI